MWGGRYNMMGWGWVVAAVLVALLVVAVIVLLRFIPRRMNGTESRPASGPVGNTTPRQILDERYAKGDLTTEEYLERVKHLGSA